MKRYLIFVVVFALMVLQTVAIAVAAQQEGAGQESAMQESTMQESAAQEGAMQEEATGKEVVAEEAPAFTIGNMVVCESVQNLSPVGTAEIFPATTPKVFVFLEAKNIVEDTSVSFVWHFEENQVAKVGLTLRKGDRWRTYSSKNLAGLKGDWKVELQDSAGKVLKAIAFRVE